MILECRDLLLSTQFIKSNMVLKINVKVSKLYVIVLFKDGIYIYHFTALQEQSGFVKDENL